MHTQDKLALLARLPTTDIVKLRAETNGELVVGAAGATPFNTETHEARVNRDAGPAGASPKEWRNAARCESWCNRYTCTATPCKGCDCASLGDGHGRDRRRRCPAHSTTSENRSS